MQTAFTKKSLLVGAVIQGKRQLCVRTVREFYTVKADLPQNNRRRGTKSPMYIVFATANTSGTKLTRRWRFEKDVQRIFRYRANFDDNRRNQLAVDRYFRFQHRKLDYVRHGLVGKIVVHFGRRGGCVYDSLAVRFRLPYGKRRQGTTRLQISQTRNLRKLVAKNKLTNKVVAFGGGFVYFLFGCQALQQPRLNCN